MRALAVALVSLVAAAPAAAQDDCRVTDPNGRGPGHQGLEDGHHGNRAIGTSLPAEGTFAPRDEQVRPDGSVRTKWPWWTRGRNPRMTIAGRRLDATGPPLTGRVFRSGSPFFRPSRVTFPSAGCWRVTARTPRARLSFVVRVVLP